MTVTSLPENVRADWAQSLATWPQESATAFDKQGLPGTKVLQAALTEAEKLGYKWPVRYAIKN